MTFDFDVVRYPASLCIGNPDTDKAVTVRQMIEQMHAWWCVACELAQGARGEYIEEGYDPLVYNKLDADQIWRPSRTVHGGSCRTLAFEVVIVALE